jgi:hypothetical protein
MSNKDLNEDVLVELKAMAKGLKYIITNAMYECARTDDLSKYPNFSSRGLALFIYCRKGKKLDTKEITWEIHSE